MPRYRPRTSTLPFGSVTANSETRLRTSTAVPELTPELGSFEDRYRALIESTRDAVLVVDRNSGRFVEVNAAAADLFGRTPHAFLNSSLPELFAPASSGADRELLSELLASSRVSRSRLQFVREDSLPFYGDLTAANFQAGGQHLCLLSIRDITQQVRRERDLGLAHESLREARAQLVHSSKLAAIGELAAGVAHEISNPAAFVSVYLSEVCREMARAERAIENLKAKYCDDLAAILALSELEHGGRSFAEVGEMLRDSLDGVQRITSTVKELRAFARIERDDTEVVDINEIVKTACKVCHTQIRYRARLEESLKATRTIVASRSRLIQVVTNLLTNAAQAIEEAAPGQHRIRVATEATEDCLLVTVEDSGRGIDPETRAKIFQPFFTTKSRDVGTGLGLALCANIVRDHLGEISVQSKPGGPTVFEVRLPFNNGLVPGWAETSRPPRNKVGSRKKLLIIDDEVQLLRAYQRSLSRYHDIEIAEGGAKGLGRILQGGNFDLIVCDLMMPDVDGVDIHTAVTEKAPELISRLVFSSGGVFTRRVQEFLRATESIQLQKPLEIGAIEEALSVLKVER